MLKEGMIVGERYEIISRIGSGGMADVYKARDHKLDRLVAVKVMKAEFSEDKGFIAKFRKEAQAAAGLAHPNVVNVYDVGEDNGIYYIVMELVQGITLKDYITRKGKLTVREATSIAIQVSLGLEAAHKNNIVHRDVKPQNIIISVDGKVKLSDFGIARAASSNTISSNVMGSVHYSSPEQVRGGFSDAKSDIYSLGITMYEMVTGHVPFDGDTTVAIAIKHLQEEMESPRKYVPDLPYSLEQIIFKCTQKSVDRRYNNMSELIEDLKHSLLDPNGNFVNLAPLTSHAQTVMLSSEELDAIREGRSGYAVPRTQEEKLPEYEEEDEEEDDEYEDDEYDEEDDDEGEISSKLEKAMTIGGFIIGAIIICILIFFIARAAGLVNFGGGNGADTEQTQQDETQDDENEGSGQVEVPNLVGQTEENAISLLEQLGLTGNKTGTAQSSEPAGTVISQETAEGTSVDVGTAINYTVSAGSESLSVPTVVGLSQSEAEAKIKALGLNTSVDRQYSDSVAVGRVISVSPEEGATVTAGDTISLVVSLGVENTQIPVPSVIGLDENTATTTLYDSGFAVSVETTDSAEGIGDGCVSAQSVAAGTEADPGTTITITVYHAPETTPEATPETTPGAGENTGDSQEGTGGTDNSSANSGAWTCNVSLQQPANYSGGVVKMTLVQDVNGTSQETVIMEDATIDFPYTLQISGADGVETGTVYLYELVDGEYVERGHYSPVTFSQAE